jgi:hypothetical protein
MSKHLLYQLKMARDWSVEVAESCTEEMAVVQPDGFKNNIHWHIGHILTAAEYFLFEIPEKNPALPKSYKRWFGPDTSPADWKESIPSLLELISQLKEQQDRMLAIPPEQFENRLTQPVFGFSIFGECAAFVSIHETLHVGKMETMIQVLNNTKKP